MVTALENLPKDELKLPVVKRTLICEVAKIKHRQSEDAPLNSSTAFSSKKYYKKNKYYKENIINAKV